MLLTETYIEYNTRDENLESFSFNEWCIMEKRYVNPKLRKLEPVWKKALKYGSAFFIPYLTGIKLGGIAGAASGLPPIGILLGGISGGFSGILSMFFTWVYRQETDHCTQRCGGTKKVGAKKYNACWNKCYMGACDNVLKQIGRDIVAMSKIKDPKKKEKMKKALLKEKQKWTYRRDKYKDAYIRAKKDNL